MPTENPKQLDPTLNVRELIDDAVKRVDDLSKAKDTQYQLQFANAEKSVGIALVAQEKAVAAALEGTREAINKADVNTDKRFDLLSEKIDGITTTMNKSTGERGIYVTHVDLANELEKLRLSIEATLRPLVTFMNTSTGKSNVEDPQMRELIKEVKSLRDAENEESGKGKGLNMGWTYLIQAVGFASVVISIFLTLK